MFARLPDLASSRLGGRVLAANDEFFAPKENLVKPERAVFIEGKYTSRGKWMDGWETRRRRTPGHDWCLIKLAVKGMVRAVNVDTSHFLGNFPPQASLDGVCVPGNPPAAKLAKASWAPVLALSPLEGGSRNFFNIGNPGPWTHLRLNIHPDGGVARLRVHGEPVLDLRDVGKMKSPIDLAAAKNGGRVEDSSDSFFGSPGNMLMPGRPRNMGEGWETRRRRGPGNDWAVIRLAVPGLIRKIRIDTTHFKGNCPESFSFEGIPQGGETGAADGEGMKPAPWRLVIPRTKLHPHSSRVFSKEIADAGPFSKVRLSIYPDGGVARLRIYGVPA